MTDTAGTSKAVDELLEYAVGEARLQEQRRVAAAEGRLYPPLAAEMGLVTGKVRCPTCGMLAWDAKAAEDCCTTPDFEDGVLRGKQWAVAVCVNPEELHQALQWVRDEKGYASFAAMSQAYGLNAMVFQRLRSGAVRWINATKWSRLVLIFGGIPPGCMEVSELQKGDEMEDEDLVTNDSWVDDKLDELEDRRRYESDEVRSGDE